MRSAARNLLPADVEVLLVAPVDEVLLRGSKFRAALRMWVRTGGARATGGGAWLISTRPGSPEPPTPTVPLPKPWAGTVCN